ncbi:excinuclease ABC subunit UvrC [Lapidilactobacillus wuchangensis]|uniref:excinuclease ABC subunit UvrC n=1 Tax=Lapidilactobacillus wuchangensis TaxID=2486001 RepID=UPI000F779662|nr:excinuclease ABC subunit UvrC [Lapidilactobacillus wuchangensis]
MASEHLEHKLALLPDLPGCYLMKNLNAQVIYVGKAKNLKNRVRSYFKSSHTGKTERLVAEIVDFETIITSTNKEAFLLEITLIQKYKPYYNIRLKQGGNYPYIKITNERDPIMQITGEIKKDGAYYFGPYTNVYAAEETMHFLQKVYPLRRCAGHLGRPCLYYHMGQCLGACFREVPVEEYQQQIERIKRFLNGHVDVIKRKLTREMQAASTELHFERAAELRDQLHYIAATVEKQKIISNDHTPRDIYGFYVDKGWLSVQIFFLRQARLMKRVKRLFPLVTDDPMEALGTFILQFYSRKDNVLPREILVPAGVEKDVLEEILQIPVRTPARGQKKALLDLANKNAKLVLDEKFRLLELDERQTLGAQNEILSALGLPDGHVLEAFDHSHIQGSEPVSAMVSFLDGRPDKHSYRKYKLKGEVEHQNGADEAANTREVIRRRYLRLLKEQKPLPDLILMDGGIIEMEAAEDVLRNELDLQIPVAGMVKNDKHKTAQLIYGPDAQPVHLDPKSQGFYLLQRIQDEVHRFAITFHRQSHSKNALSSRLETIQGVGPKTRTKLLKHFGSMKKIKSASLEEIQELGISKTVAQTIKLAIQ